jgi:hypothetical protein
LRTRSGAQGWPPAPLLPPHNAHRSSPASYRNPPIPFAAKQVYEVQEEFTFGCALELARSRGADRVAGGGKKTLDAVAAGITSASNKARLRGQGGCGAG